jgi:protein-S-isoprenylcysteine O-methyltransferase Ste14
VRKITATAGSGVFLVIAPGVVAGLVPWWITGTPAPPVPTERLVVQGLYRYVRNPMYIAVLAIIVGQALLLSRPVLLGYGAAVGAAFIAFVYGYEQPALARRYGAQYAAYRQAVPAWWPRLTRRRTSRFP